MRAVCTAVVALVALLAIACGGGNGFATPTRVGGTPAAASAAPSRTVVPPDASTARPPATADAATAALATGLPATVSPTTTLAPATQSAAALICASAAPDTVTGTLQSPEMNETSGLSLSRDHAGVIWAHNDSGDTARFFAIDQSGALLATYNLPGVTAIDWEDIAIGAGSGPDFLYLGDIGDNLSVRPEIVVYRMPEPDPALDGPGTHDVTGVTAIHLTYPDTPHDAETLMIDPSNGDLVVITKDIAGGPSSVYVLHGASVASGTNTLEHLTDIPFGAFAPQKAVPEGSPPLPSALGKVPTGGEISPAGDVIAERTYGTIWIWSRDAGQSLAGALAAPPCEGPSAIEAQGESIAFDPDGGGYWTVSEGANAPLHHFRWR
jgi:hypothetical protein